MRILRASSAFSKWKPVSSLHVAPNADWVTWGGGRSWTMILWKEGSPCCTDHPSPLLRPDLLFSLQLVQTSKIPASVHTSFLSHSPQLRGSVSPWVGLGRGGGTEGMVIIIVNALQTEKEYQKEAQGEVERTLATHWAKEGCWGRGAGSVRKRQG